MKKPQIQQILVSKTFYVHEKILRTQKGRRKFIKKFTS